MKEVRIARKIIGRSSPAFIIAEAGINHNGRLRLALELIRQAKKCGADAVKFQTFKAESLCSQGSTYFPLFKSLEFPPFAWKKISSFCKKEKIIFLSTPFDEEAANLLAGLRVPAFKIASGDLTHLPFLAHVAKKNKPLIISTGAADMAEIKEALTTVYSAGNRRVILLHCVSVYPAPPEEVNLKAIISLGKRFKVPVGFSDHTSGSAVALAAISLGAKVIEKHFTLNKRLSGPDHRLSLNPGEFKTMVSQIRQAELALGSGKKQVSKSEKRIKNIIRRSVIAAVDIPCGMLISKKMLKISRPATGVSPKFMSVVVGRRAVRAVKKEQPVTWQAVGIKKCL